MPKALKIISALTRSAPTVAPNIEDNGIVRAGNDMEIGDNVIVGHCAMVHSRKMGNDVLISKFDLVPLSTRNAKA